jgi:hypothetical protein
MEVSFGKGTTTVVPQQETVSAPSVETGSSPLVPAVIPSGPISSPAPTGLVLGDKLPDFSEIILPRINLGQALGEVGKIFPLGSIVLGQQICLFSPPDIDPKSGTVRRAATPPVNITVLGFRPTRFCEKTNGGVRGLIVNTEDEVRRNGGTLDYKEFKLKEASGMKRFEPLADALVLIERPESCADDDTVFIYEANGKKYALALWAMRGTTYTAAAKRVFFTHRAIGCLRRGYPTHNYSVTTRFEDYQNNHGAWIPICVPSQKSTPEFLALVASLIGGATAPASPAEIAAPAPAE